MDNTMVENRCQGMYCCCTFIFYVWGNNKILESYDKHSRTNWFRILHLMFFSCVYYVK